MGVMKRASPILVAVVLAGCGTDVTGPSSSLLACVFGQAMSPSAGQVIQVRGPDNQGVCLNGGTGAEFVFIPFNGASGDGNALNLELTGAGVSDPGTLGLGRTGLGPRISLGAARQPGYVMDRAFHHRLRRSEVEELEPRIRPGTVAALRSSVAADVPNLGELRDLNVATSCDGSDIRTGEVVYISDHAVIMEDTANADNLTAADYAYFGETFDTLIYTVETGHFGAPTDIDDNQRAILFFTRAVNERNPGGSQTLTIGFFWSGDLFPRTGSERLQACAASNESEMFYLVTPDPDGEVGVAVTRDQVRDYAIPLIGHEFQHLINASRRLFVNNANTFEDGWLNEGLSHVAEELLFLAVAGLSTGSNWGIEDIRDANAVDSFNRYMGGNFNNLGGYLERPDTASLMGDAVLLATRGASWSFLRYAADRSGRSDEQFFFDVVNGTEAGLDNLDDVVGSGAARDWIRDWTVSLYADDFVDGIEPRFSSTTWNWRSIFEGSTLGTYPLNVRDLVSGETSSTNLPAGGAIFNRFGIAAEGRAVIHVHTDESRLPATLRGSFLRVR
jgi:hypothetical protein